MAWIDRYALLRSLLVASLLAALPSLLVCDEPSDGDGDGDGDLDGDGDADLDGDGGGDGGWEPRFDGLAATIEAERLALGAPGAAFAVIEAGEVVFAAGFGSRHPDRPDELVGSATLFRIGSVTKLLTAIALLQQVEAGVVDLDAPITDSLPDFSFAADGSWAPSILVRHVLEHASAMFDYTELTEPDDERLEMQMLWYGQSFWLMAPSGRMWNYSNPNYSMAGWIVERTSGYGYREYMADQVFGPLGMERTYFLGAEVLADGDYASGLTVDWETGVGRVVAGPESYDSGFSRPAGFAWSSVRDLADLLIFLLRGDARVLSDDLRAELAAEQIDCETLADEQHYGFGLFVERGFFVGDDYFAARLVHHGGDIPGFAADVFLLPDLEAGVVALASTDGAHFGEAVVEALALLEGFPGPVDPPVGLAFDTSAMEDFEGDYLDPYNMGRMTVTADGSVLRITMPDLQEAGIGYDDILQPFARDNVVATIDGVPIVLTFLRDSASTVEYARTRYGVFEAQAGGKVAWAAPVAVDAARLRRALRAARPPSLRPW